MSVSRARPRLSTARGTEALTLPFPLSRACRPQLLRGQLRQQGRSVRSAESADASSMGSSWMDMPESTPLPDEPLQIFPRLKERDPHK